MKAFYAGDRRAQFVTIGLFAGILLVVILGIVLHSATIGLVGVLAACASVIWLARRRSDRQRR
jgi:Flp pilus assembly protein TadB